MSEIIICPTGLTGRIRGMKVREERIIADRKLATAGGQVDELLAACWEETLDAGPYVLAEGAKLDLGKVLQGSQLRWPERIHIGGTGDVGDPIVRLLQRGKSPETSGPLALPLRRKLTGETRLASPTRFDYHAPSNDTGRDRK